MKKESSEGKNKISTFNPVKNKLEAVVITVVKSDIVIPHKKEFFKRFALVVELNN